MSVSEVRSGRSGGSTFPPHQPMAAKYANAGRDLRVSVSGVSSDSAVRGRRAKVLISIQPCAQWRGGHGSAALCDQGSPTTAEMKYKVRECLLHKSPERVSLRDNCAGIPCVSGLISRVPWGFTHKQAYAFRSTASQYVALKVAPE